MTRCFAGVVVASFLAGACGKAATSLPRGSPLSPAAQVAGLTVSISQTSAGAGLARTWTFQATALARFADGSEQNVTEAAAWISSAPGVARISPTGAITGQGPGRTEIRATYQGLSRSVFFCLEDDC
jgi:hypothetical protein